MIKLPQQPARTVISLCACLITLAAFDAHADFFKYKDSGGNTIITNRMEDVPQKYRNRVKVIWDKDLEAKDPVARRRAAQQEQMEQQKRQQTAQREQVESKKKKKKEKTLVIELDETTGEVKRRFE